jgi:phenylpropionate dioxygenase-like ring-hydroxylating dioxygenase large terminal subunit
MDDQTRRMVAFPADAWYPACRSGDLRRKPVAITLMDQPVVVFRDGSGRAHALEDRCPHRNLALSMGKVHGDGSLECGYHGWRFDGAGRCTAVPGLVEGGAADAPARCVPTRATREVDGFVWVWGRVGAHPVGDPVPLPTVEGPGTGQVVFAYDLDCTLHAALENALDVPHTAFLHQGVFRGGDAREITAVRRDLPGGLEVQYLGEPVGLGRIRGDQGSELTFDHWDRFLLPSTAQIEYRVEGWLRIVNTILHLPLGPTRTRAWFVVRYWTRFPARVVQPIVALRGRQILRQDAKVLAAQTTTIGRFGGERYSSTDLDLLGPAIWRMLRQAEKGTVKGTAPAAGAADDDGPDTAPTERSITFTV